MLRILIVPTVTIKVLNNPKDVNKTSKRIMLYTLFLPDWKHI